MKEVQFQMADQVKWVKFEQTDDQFRVQVDGHEYQVKVKQTGEQRLLLNLDGPRLELYVAFSGDRCYVWLDGQTWTVERVSQTKERSTAKHAAAQPAATGRITATMPGLVRAVLVEPGAAVVRGAPVVLLEAMKMELRLTAPHAGQVSQVHCAAGQVVERGQLLVEISETVGQ
ncbi:MAG: biotin/lipoyl-containing protein [Caldilineaceae bacterium]